MTLDIQDVDAIIQFVREAAWYDAANLEPAQIVFRNAVINETNKPPEPNSALPLIRSRLITEIVCETRTKTRNPDDETCTIYWPALAEIVRKAFDKVTDAMKLKTLHCPSLPPGQSVTYVRTDELADLQALRAQVSALFETIGGFDADGMAEARLRVWHLLMRLRGYGRAP